MNTEGFERLFKMNKNFSGPLTDVGKLATQIYTHAAQQHMEIIGENIERFTEQLKRLSSIKSPEELLNEQKNCLNEDVTATIETVQKVIHTSMESMEELTKLCGTICESAAHQQQKYYAAEKSHPEKRDKDK